MSTGEPKNFINFIQTLDDVFKPNSTTTTWCDPYVWWNSQQYAVKENQDGLEIKVATPGLTKEKVKVSTEQGRNIRVTVTEIPVGWNVKDQLIGSIDEKFDLTNIKPKLRDGLLTITIPLSAASRAREVQIE